MLKTKRLFWTSATCSRGHANIPENKTKSRGDCRLCERLRTRKMYRKNNPPMLGDEAVDLEQLRTRITPRTCVKGHQFTPVNRTEQRSCRICNNEAQIEYRKNNKAAVKERTHVLRRKITYVFRMAIFQAKTRGLSFDLTFDEFKTLRKNPCHYCGGALPETTGGLDRIDNSIGYEHGNVLPCCKDCNFHRGNKWTVAEAEIAIRAVVEYRRRRQLVIS